MSHDHEAVVTALLKHGAAVDHASTNGDNALSLAAGKGHEGVVARLRAAV